MSALTYKQTQRLGAFAAKGEAQGWIGDADLFNQDRVRIALAETPLERLEAHAISAEHTLKRLPSAVFIGGSILVLRATILGALAGELFSGIEGQIPGYSRADTLAGKIREEQARQQADSKVPAL